MELASGGPPEATSGGVGGAAEVASGGWDGGALVGPFGKRSTNAASSAKVTGPGA